VTFSNLASGHSQLDSKSFAICMFLLRQKYTIRLNHLLIINGYGLKNPFKIKTIPCDYLVSTGEAQRNAN